MNQTTIVTVSAYALGKEIGIVEAMRELERQVQTPTRESLPAVRVIARLRELCDVIVRVDTGGTVLGKVRSRHAHAAWESGAEVWLSCDDDVEATTSTLLSMLQAVGDPTPSIVLAPYIIRSATTLVSVASVEIPRIVTSERVLSGPGAARLRPVPRGGFGLVAMNRAALELVRGECLHLAYVDDDGVERLGLFHDQIRGKRWLGEDLAFFEHVPARVRVEALLTGHTVHDGEALDLSAVES
jgi:hypothetical protein